VAGLTPPSSARPTMVRQRWRAVTFLHWSVPPEALAPLVPAPLTLDTLEGRAWITLTSFSTTCEVLGRAPLPGPHRFPETNVRTYARGPDGRDGLWFLSLDVTHRGNVVLGRLLGLPYSHGALAMDETDLRYAGRRDGSPGRYHVQVASTGPLVAGALDVFLTGRWSAYVRRGPLTLRVDVHHEPWPLEGARLRSFEQTGLLPPIGVDLGTPAVAHCSPGVDARLSAPRPVALERCTAGPAGERLRHGTRQ
jgi:uncharacterized protein YqjF (DUF2071 family)